MLIEEKGVFQNLIINITDEQEESYILRYKPSDEWLEQKPRRGGFSSYSGTIDIQEIDGTIRASSVFDNGKAIPIKLSKNGRSSACFAAFEMTWTEVTVNGNTYITEIDVYEYIYIVKLPATEEGLVEVSEAAPDLEVDLPVQGQGFLIQLMSLIF